LFKEFGVEDLIEEQENQQPKQDATNFVPPHLRK